MLKFKVYVDNSGEWRWRLVAGNNKVIADSGESYKEKKDCEEAIVLVKSADVDTSVEDAPKVD